MSLKFVYRKGGVVFLVFLVGILWLACNLWLLPNLPNVDAYAPGATLTPMVWCPLIKRQHPEPTPTYIRPTPTPLPTPRPTPKTAVLPVGLTDRP